MVNRPLCLAGGVQVMQNVVLLTQTCASFHAAMSTSTKLQPEHVMHHYSPARKPSSISKRAVSKAMAEDALA